MYLNSPLRLLYRAKSPFLTTSSNGVVSSNRQSSIDWPRFKLYNSLTKNKDTFKPDYSKPDEIFEYKNTYHFTSDYSSRQVKWYICGPTVNDGPHMGHARTYVAFDIVRRVIQDYFRYNVRYVMNVTDVDDEIIKNARQQHLLTSYLDERNGDFKVDDIIKALAHFKENHKAETDDGKRKMHAQMMIKAYTANKILNKARMYSEINAECELEYDKEAVSSAKSNLLSVSREILAEWLDFRKGNTVNDHSVFDEFAKKYENKFFSDMARLHVLPPDETLRVSEHIPQIIAYIEKILSQGYGYPASDGSVYFDTGAYSAVPSHSYCKLWPNDNLDADGKPFDKNVIGTGVQITRHPKDFALWKSSKPGEPFWNSPWGKGRPSWYTQCSALCSGVLGSVDIQAGSEEFKYHHDNGIAQCEAHSGKGKLANFYLHSGHLWAKGWKTKSLEDYMTIDEALEQFTPRQIRIFFLMRAWNKPIMFNKLAMKKAVEFDYLSDHFHQYVKSVLRKHEPTTGMRYTKHEIDLLKRFKRAKKEFHAALCDSVDTQKAMGELKRLFECCKSYIEWKESADNYFSDRKPKLSARPYSFETWKEEKYLRITPNCELVREIAEYITSQLRMFGIPTYADIGYLIESDSNLNENCRSALATFRKNVLAITDHCQWWHIEPARGIFEECEKVSDKFLPGLVAGDNGYLQVLANFRMKVRSIAIVYKIGGIIRECDKLRDEILPSLGVKLEDRCKYDAREVEFTAIYLIDKETAAKEAVRKEIEEKRLQAVREKRRLNAKHVAEQEKIDARKAKRLSITYSYYKKQGKFSEYDEKGIPTFDVDGRKVRGGERKYYVRLQQIQDKLFEEYLAKQNIQIDQE